MHTFSDTQGRPWTITLNVDAIRRVRSVLNINLLEAIEGKLLERLITDPVLLCDILFVVIQPEAIAKEISDEDFGRSLGGDVLDVATTALLEELVDFFPSAKRTVFRKALTKLKQLETLAIETATQRLESNELEQQMQAAISGTQVVSTSGNSSGSSPGSPVSIPDYLP